MIASLPMYDPPHLQWANDAFWQAIRAALPFDTPATLTRGPGLWELWEDPDLLFTQTCGLPYAMRLHGKVHLVATPDFGLRDAAPGHYHSTIITRASEAPRPGMRLAINGTNSQSGWGAAIGFAHSGVLVTGAHVDSMAAVRAEEADICFVDSLTLALNGLPDGLTTHGHSPSTPATPYITARPEWVAPLRAALETALTTMPAAARAALHLRGIVTIPAAQYLAVPRPEAPQLA
ncbi:MAG: hypothetical protein AAF618_11140 [Pseudomonadota bacterium]